MGIEKLFGIKPKASENQTSTVDNKDDNKSKNKQSKKQYAHTVQETIPYEAVYGNGIMKVGNNRYSRTYSVSDINFRTAGSEEQEGLFQRFIEMLNSLVDANIQISCVNKRVDAEVFEKDYFVQMRHDNLDIYREEYNKLFANKLTANGGIVSEKFFTLTIASDDIESAARQFSRLDTQLINAVHGIGGSVAKVLTLNERMSLLHDIFNPYETERFVFDIDSVMKQGLTSKDVIAPGSINVMKDYLQLDDTYCCSMFVETLPASLSTEFISEINEMPFNFISSVHLAPYSQESSVKLLSHQITNINSAIQSAEKKAAQRGYSSDTISPDLRNAKNEAEALRERLMAKNQKLYSSLITMTVFAQDKDTLQKYIDIVRSTAQKYMCIVRKLSWQQEAGLAAALPIGNNTIPIKRMLTTETAALFSPYSTASLLQKGGIYYGQNAMSDALIIVNRLENKNANGIILGKSGSGKSFIAKEEMACVYLSTDADLRVVDPDNEYTPLAESFGGEVIKLALGHENYINPFDMSIRYAEDTNGKEDPIAMKADFVCSICETIIGGRYGLNPIQRSIIDRCVREIYRDYLQYMSEHPELEIDYDRAPTLVDFYECLKAQREGEARSLAAALETYSIGSFDIFAHKTNVRPSSRFVVYDIKDLGSTLYEVGLKVCLNDIWNKTIENRSRNKNTWFYLDEFYLLMRTESSAQFLQEIFKRARKWGGVPTGITQDVEDLLSSSEARAILSNCDFVTMLDQSPLAASTLSELYDISPALQAHFKNVGHGHGLIYTNNTVVPFINEYPRDSKLYTLFSSKMGETAKDLSQK